ncbi:aa3-type cytochrome c oxidase subunit IV [uncultured Sphingomonas sp.]
MADDTDIKTHEATYHSILGLMKYGAGACFVIAMIVVFFISGK